MLASFASLLVNEVGQMSWFRKLRRTVNDMPDTSLIKQNYLIAESLLSLFLDKLVRYGLTVSVDTNDIDRSGAHRFTEM